MSWITDTETGLLVQAQTLFTNARAYATELGFDQDTLTEMQEAVEDFESSISAKNIAQDQAHAAVGVNNARKAALIAELQSLNRTVQANSEITDDLKRRVGFPVYKKPSRGAPQTPTNLKAKVEGQTGVFLRWSRGTNPESAIFTIEWKVGSGPWTTLASTNATRYRFETTRPGTPTQFRVIATRGSQDSAPSVAASLWADGGTNSLSLAA